jgi:hypothetical protein
LLTSIIQGAIAISLTIMLAAFVISTPYAQHLISQILENPSIGYMEISALAGLGLYFLVGVLGSRVACFFYHYFEFHLGKNFDRLTNGLAWIHLLLTNIGVSSASLTMIYAGYIGDLAIFPKEIGGFGMTAMQASSLLNPFIVPVGIMLLVATIGAICGGSGFIITFVKR